MSKSVVILGGGPGGYSAALYCAKLGLEVALVEQRPYFGGTCLNEGCISTKAFVQASHVYAQIAQAGRYGIHVGGAVGVEGEETAHFKQGVVNQLRNGVKHLLRKAKVQTIQGHGELLSPQEVQVTGEGESRTLWADAVIVATGSREIELPGLEADGTYILNSTQMLDAKSFPDSVIIVGGGVIGVEFACILRRFGKMVTVVELSDRLIPTEDAQISQLLRRELEAQGIAVLTGTSAREVVRKSGGVIEVRVSHNGGEDETLSAAQMLVCVGRRANLEGIGLERVGVVHGRAIPTDSHMRTNVPGIYAIGDVTESPQLAHVAYHEALVAAKHIAGQPMEADYHAIPACIFSHPEVASVGMSEEAAKKVYADVAVQTDSFAGNGKAMIEGENRGLIKLVMAGPDRKIVGVSIIGPKATELIAEPAMAVTGNITAADFASVIHAHPSLAEIIGEAAGAAAGMGLHS